MKVSAAHLEAFIGALEDCGFHGGEVKADPDFRGRGAIVLRGKLTNRVPAPLAFHVQLVIDFDPKHGITAAMYPPAMVRAHCAAGLNREASRYRP